MFGIENSKDRLNQLKENFKSLQKDSLNISLAEKTCSDAWHLIDWVYEEKKIEDSSLTKQNFRIFVYNNCNQMKILHDLVNSFKHKKLTSPKVHIKKTITKQGDFSGIFSNDFNISRLEIYYGNQSKISVNELIKTTIGFWEKLI
ncbi:hypothetical protein LG651_13855 [Tamlana sp. 62-3]|uniref:Uncharacterized protein n=1 Tax=Neotamlana sargassicola TaxID=2883125 RepID=A0A9X1I8P4_9FLAO|nr:hypothetical protein [Tamlana sargassicola]MCB4809337.1 hypothetical protein [Tamlana sargassicola]